MLNVGNIVDASLKKPEAPLSDTSKWEPGLTSYWPGS